jgi:hypothetical protein
MDTRTDMEEAAQFLDARERDALTAENARLTEDNKRIGELGRICIRQDQTIADMTAENARLRGEVDSLNQTCEGWGIRVERLEADLARVSAESEEMVSRLHADADHVHEYVLKQDADLARVTAERDRLLAAAKVVVCGKILVPGVTRQVNVEWLEALKVAIAACAPPATFPACPKCGAVAIDYDPKDCACAPPASGEVK